VLVALSSFFAVVPGIFTRRLTVPREPRPEADPEASSVTERSVPSQSSLLQVGGQIVFWSLVLVAAATIVLSIVPGLLNHQLLTVDGGSMEPTFSAGDAVLTRPIEDPAGEIKPGDIIVVQSPVNGVRQAHRVLEIAATDSGQTLFRTAGDANAAPDAAWARPEDVRAMVVTSLPRLGMALSLLSDPLARLVLFVLPLLYLGCRELFLGLYGEVEPEDEAP
jgi:signal peptidase